jgi:hypothetical protein
MSCAATEEYPDGSENSASEDLVWDYQGDDVTISLERKYLLPDQAVTLRITPDQAPDAIREAATELESVVRAATGPKRPTSSRSRPPRSMRAGRIGSTVPDSASG